MMAGNKAFKVAFECSFCETPFWGQNCGRRVLEDHIPGHLPAFGSWKSFSAQRRSPGATANVRGLKLFNKRC